MSVSYQRHVLNLFVRSNYIPFSHDCIPIHSFGL